MGFDKLCDGAKLNAKISDIVAAVREKNPGALSGLDFYKGDIERAIRAIPTGNSPVTPSGGNCEAYVVDAGAPKASFFKITSGPIKAWGEASKGGVISTTRYTFYGTEYRSGSSTYSMNLSIDSAGNIKGLPAVDRGTLLITRGV